MNAIFPEIIDRLPEAGYGIPGVTIRVSRTDTHDVWFLTSETDLDYPPHAHPAQWSVVLEGRIHVTMNGETRCYGKGDRYFLPAGVEHQVKLEAGETGYAEVIFLDNPKSH